MLTGAQLRMARAALRISAATLAEKAECNMGTIARIEAGKGAYRMTLRRLREVLEESGAVFIPPQIGVHDGAVGLKPGLDLTKETKSASYGASTDGEQGALDALDWDWEAADLDDDAPLEPLDWDDAIKAEQLAYWRAMPERWAALAEVSRLCLLRAMGVERL
jgi:transcriptional regulator with XRE-family HTH domain